MQETQETPIPGSGRAPWRRQWQPTPAFLPEKFHGQRSLAGYSPWGSQRLRHDWAHTHKQFNLSQVWSLLFVFFLFLPHYTACEIFVLQLGIEPMCPQNWEYRGLNTGLPKKSLNSFWSSLLLENLSIRHFLHNLNHYLSNYSTFLWDNLDK